jgi:TolA-binding protein
MSRSLRALVVFLSLIVVAQVTVAAEPPELPAPSLVPFLQLAIPALDKPPVSIPAIGLPAPPQRFPELPPPRFVTDARPIAPLAPPRMLACNPLGSVFGVPSELVECGRARYQRGELDEARTTLQSAAQRSTDRVVVREARYWLAETLLRLDRVQEAEHHLHLVAQDDPRGELGLYAAHALGWVALRLNQPARALQTFEQIIRGSAPPEISPYARHGRAMALYALRRYPEAKDAWTSLLNQSVPRALAAEAQFWLGETLGRLGDHAGAVSRLQIFAAGGPQLFIETGLLRLGWWSRAAGQPLEAVKAYRGLLSAYPRTAEGLWARAGLVQALLELDDYPAAREEVRRLESLDRQGTLMLPSLLLLTGWTVEKSRTDEAQALLQELLTRNLEPATRAYVLVLSGEAHRQLGQTAEARNQFQAVRNAPGARPLGWHAALRLAEMDFQAREFAQAYAGAEALLREPLPAELRAAALVLAAESSYWAQAHARAGGLYSQFLTDFHRLPQAQHMVLALAWTEFKRNRPDEARRLWTRFAEDSPADPRTAEALLMAAELAAKANDTAAAQALLDRLITRFPQSEHADTAILNRAILAIRQGRGSEALRDLSELVGRATLSPFAGRMRLARGIVLLEVDRYAEAQSDFREAAQKGDDAVAHLGLGAIALEQRQWPEAAREFAEARRGGAAGVAAAAEYGLAAAAFNQGRKDDFKRFAAPLLSGPPDPAATPHLVHGMTLIASEEKSWSEARGFARRLAAEFPAHEATPAAVARLGAAASREAQWPVAREAYQLLADRYSKDPGNEEGRVDFAEALLRTGAAAEARRRLQAFVDSAPGDPRMPRALLLLAQASEATGDRAGALQAYTRLARDYPTAAGSPRATLAQATLLQSEGKWDQARPLLEKVLGDPDPAVATEAAYQMGEALRVQGQHQEAAESYMTASYLAPDSAVGRKALLGAAQAYAALKQKDSAVIVYRKLLASSGLEPDLAEEARKGLKALGVN